MNLKTSANSLFYDKQNYLFFKNLFFKRSLVIKLTTLLIFVVHWQVSAKAFSHKITPDLIKSSFEPLKVALANQPFSYKISEETILINQSNGLQKAEIRQQLFASGRIVDDNGDPISKASVIEKGTNNQVVANNNGEFKISISKAGVILVFSCVGYTSRQIPAETNPMRIVLKSDVQSLTDVVITGYQQIKKESFTGSVSKVKASDIQVASMGTLDKMLQGQVAGVTIETASSVFGTAPKIRIRGSSSLSGINEPLWVLDGVALETPLRIAASELYSGAARNLLASALSGVNPEDIEDISVLKDATATAMYGTRAVNGVIVITTKRAKKNTPLNINYNSNATLTLKPSITSFDVLNSYDQTVLNQQIFRIYQSSLMDFSAQTSGAYSKLRYEQNVKSFTDEQFRAKTKDLKTVNTDWFDYLYKNALMQQHSLSASYGGENASARLSVSYYDDLGKTLGEKVQRYTVNLNSGYQISKNLAADIMVKFSKRNQHNPGTKVNPFRYARDAARNMRPYDENGNFEYYKKGYTNFNIIEEINNDYIDLSGSDFLVQADLKYKFANNLTLSGIFNTRFVNSDVSEIQTEFSNYANQFRKKGVVDLDGFLLSDKNERLYKNPSKALYLPAESVLPEGGILDRETSTSKFYTGRFQLEWDVLNNLKDHSVSILAGGEIAANNQNGYFNRGYGYLTTNKTTSPNYLALQRLIEATNLPDDEKRMYNGRNLLAGTNYYYTMYNRNTVAYYAKAEYNYLKKYVLEFYLRNDAANITLSRFTPTWSAGIGWNLSNENFMKSIENTISNAKIRFTYGLRGNDGDRGPAIVSYPVNITRVYPNYNSTAVSVLEPENTDLRFEKEYSINFGIDFTLLNYADISANIYRKNNFDLIGDKQVAYSSGYRSKQFNWANMRNQGVELSINLRPIKLVSNLQLTLMVNAAYNKNTVLSDLSGSKPTIFQIARSEGYSMQGGARSGLYAFRLAGLSKDGLPQYYNGKGEIVPTFISSSTNLADLEYQGTRDPKYSGGFTPALRYKNLSLSAAFIFNAGHVVRLVDFYRDGTISSLFRDDLNTPGDFANRWTAPGDERYTIIPKLITDDDIDNYANSGFFSQSIFTAYNYNNMRTVNASYLRFRNLNIQYSFPALSKKLKIRSFSIAAEASNIAIWSSKRLKGQDPETLLSGLNLPPVKSFTVSLNASF